MKQSSPYTLMIDRNVEKNLWGTYHEDIKEKPADYLSAEPMSFTAIYLLRHAKENPQYVKMARHMAEEGRVAIRNVRRDVMRHLEELVRNGDVGDDDERRAEQEVQKLTDAHTKTIDELLKHKEAEIMEV